MNYLDRVAVLDKLALSASASLELMRAICEEL